jgi:transcriptional regulator with XRE-family HTH domain
MKERLLEFLRAENKSSAQLAEEIGVQPSGISHILSGRNNPSLDFVLKMLDKYQFLSTDWLLFGKGSMYRDLKIQTLFDQENILKYNNDEKQIRKEPAKSLPDRTETEKNSTDNYIQGSSGNKSLKIERIIWFYDNNSFEEYFPAGKEGL